MKYNSLEELLKWRDFRSFTIANHVHREYLEDYASGAEIRATVEVLVDGVWRPFIEYGEVKK